MNTPPKKTALNSFAKVHTPSLASQNAGAARRPVAPPVYRPQPKPVAVQTKTAFHSATANGIKAKSPAAPPVYRPQPLPRCLQLKTAGNNQRLTSGAQARPVAPPAYRPQPTPVVLQLRAATKKQPHAGHATHGRSCGCKSGTAKTSATNCHCSTRATTTPKVVQRKMSPAGPVARHAAVFRGALLGAPVIQLASRGKGGKKKGGKAAKNVKVTKDGVEYADSEADAKALIIAYAKRLDEPISADDLIAYAGIAMNKGLGIDQAERAVLGKQQERRQQERMAERRAEFGTDVKELETDALEPDTLGHTLLRLSFDRYVGGTLNAGVAGSYSQDEVDDACRDWNLLQQTRKNPKIRFWGYRCQDKKGAGKGNVGDTLDERYFQANFLSSWGGAQVNIHVDLDVDHCPARCECENVDA